MMRRLPYLAAVETTTHTESYEALQAENEVLRQRLRAAEAQVEVYQKRLAQLEHELAQFKRLVFGTKQERFVPSREASAQEASRRRRGPSQTLPLPEKKSAAACEPPRRKPVRQVFPSHLPREVIVIEPEGDLTGLKKIGEEITETLAYRPARLVVLRRVRPKYVDPRNEERGVIIATLPARAIEKGMAEPSLLAHVVIEKYVDHRVSGNVHARWGKAPRSRSAETGCKPP
jgi:hypothetical protein